MKQVRLGAAFAAAAFLGVILVGGAGAASKAFVGCGSTVTSNVTLASDLNCSAGGTNGLTVGANGVTINLNGHTITGGGGPDGYAGVDAQTYDHVTIKNGSIKNFTTGVAASGATVQIAGVNIVLDGDFSGPCPSPMLVGVFLQGASKAKVTGVVVSNTGAPTDSGTCNDGVGAYGIGGIGMTRSTFSKNTVSGMNGSFVGFQSSDNTWSKNTSTGVPGVTLGFADLDGGYGFNGVGNTYNGDVATGGAIGFYFEEDTNGLNDSGYSAVTLTGSTGNSNTNAGLYLDKPYYCASPVAGTRGPAPTCTGSTISGNTFQGNGEDGVQANHPFFTSFNKNNAVGNTDDGFDLRAACNASVTGNKAINNGDNGFVFDNDGLGLSGWCDNTVATKNLGQDNGNDGFQIHNYNECGNGLFDSNTATGNNDTGMWAEDYYVPGLKNVSTGNDDNNTWNLNVTKTPGLCG